MSAQQKSAASVALVIMLLTVIGFWTVSTVFSQGTVNPRDNDFNVIGQDMYQMPAGNVGFGTMNPAYKLDVQGDVAVTGQMLSTCPDGTAPLTVDSSTRVANLNADTVDGVEGGELARGYRFFIPPGGGDMTIPLKHYQVHQIMISDLHGAPEEVAFVTVGENDRYVAWLGFDGAGNQVKGTASLYTVTTILTLSGGGIYLETPGDGSYTLNLHSNYQDCKATLVR